MDNSSLSLPTFSGIVSGRMQTFFLPYFPGWNLKKGDPFKILAYAPDGTLESSRTEQYGATVTLLFKQAGTYRLRAESMDGKQYFEHDFLSLD